MKGVGVFCPTLNLSVVLKPCLEDTYPAPRGPLPFRALAANGANIEIKSEILISLVPIMLELLFGLTDTDINSHIRPTDPTEAGQSAEILVLHFINS